MADATDWAAVYRRSVALERIWSLKGAPEPVARQFLRGIVHGHQTEAAILREIRSFRLDPPPDDLLAEAFFLQRTLYPSDRMRPAGRHPSDPMENVYAAALSMLPHGFWVESPELDQVYRGQRNATWPTLPSLFRKADTPDALAQLAAAVARIRVSLPHLSEAQCVAVAQHYSKELNLETWLLDVTYDPRVALFFASDGGEEGDLGVVCCIVRKEWETLSAEGTNRLGQLRVIDVPGVLRIERQRASFLDTSHPDLFDQYVAHSVWFKQVAGLTFEDLAADHPVSAARLYPVDDPLLGTLQEVGPCRHTALAIGPAGDAREPLTSAHYWDIAQSWCRQAGVKIDAYREDTLHVVCDVHARLQQLRHEFELPERSLARVHDAVSLILDAQRDERFITPHDALRWSLSRLPTERRAKLEAIINEYTRARGLC